MCGLKELWRQNAVVFIVNILMALPVLHIDLESTSVRLPTTPPPLMEKVYPASIDSGCCLGMQEAGNLHVVNIHSVSSAIETNKADERCDVLLQFRH